MEKEIIQAHSISGGMNNPPEVAQRLAGVELVGRVTDLSDGPMLFEIELDSDYYDDREKIIVVPVEFYGDMVRIRDGRSCHKDYARQHWESV